MPKTKTTFALIALLLASALFGACGGSDDESSTATTASTPARTTPAGGSGGGASGEQAPRGTTAERNDEATATGRTGASAQQESASLATDPGSIDGATVTSTGAVQTLPPSDSSQAEALENSYSSIKAFGEESSGSEATDITYALVQYLNAKAQGDWATACARLYGVLRRNFEKDGKSCPDTYGSLMGRVSAVSRTEAARIDVASVRRGEGDRAFVIYKTPATLSVDMPLYLEEGVWTVGALEAYALTPEQLEAGK